MKTLPLIFAAAGMLSSSWAQEPRSALQALKVLSRSDAANVTRIVAREGNPSPGRWHFIVYDGAAQRGFRECVVAEGELVASREVSQFADRLKLEDVVGASVLKVDSDKAAKLAQEYAQANQMQVASVDYDLAKEGVKAVPVWKVSCLDEEGALLGELSVTATQGAVISHDGFLLEPKGAPGKARPHRASVKPEPAEPAHSEPAARPANAAPAPVAAKPSVKPARNPMSATLVSTRSGAGGPVPLLPEVSAGRRLFNRLFQR